MEKVLREVVLGVWDAVVGTVVVLVIYHAKKKYAVAGLYLEGATPRLTLEWPTSGICVCPATGVV
jgi:hypothetical protein